MHAKQGRISLRLQPLLKSRSAEKSCLDVDWVAKWFDLYQEHGECMEMRFVKLVSGKLERIYSVPHQKTDGIGALLTLMKAEGWKGELRFSPKRIRPWDRFRKWKSVLLYPYRARTRSTRWLKYEAGARGSSPLVWRILNPEKSKSILSACGGKSLDLSSFFLWTLNRAARSRVSDRQKTNTWWIPFDMRGFFPDEQRRSFDLERNFASHFAVDISKDFTVSRLHAQLRRRLLRWDYWGAWIWLNSGRYLGERGMRAILNGQIKKQNRWMGTFNYFGRWPKRGLIPPEGDQSVWFGVSPVTRGHPISASAGVWRENIVLALQLHAAIMSDEREAERLLQEWVTVIEGQCVR